jgi:hypothetical protein
MIAAFEAVKALHGKFPVNNPRASADDMIRHLRGETEHFPCYGETRRTKCVAAMCLLHSGY